jgi:hypothetical protein
MPDDFTRLLWVLLPLALDREGRGIDNPAWVRARVFPLRSDVTEAQIDGALACYAAAGLIQRYRAGGHGYFWMPAWRAQQGDCSREAASNYPAPPAADTPPHQPATVASPVPPEPAPACVPERIAPGTSAAAAPAPAQAPAARPAGDGRPRRTHSRVAHALLLSRSRAGPDPDTDSDSDTESDSESYTHKHDCTGRRGWSAARGGCDVVYDIAGQPPPDERRQEHLRAELAHYLWPEMAERLAEAFPERVSEQIAHYRWARNQGRARGPGWLVRAIVEDWHPPPEAEPWLCAADPLRYITGEYGELIQH